MWDSCSNTVMCYVPKWVAVDLDGPAGEQPVCSLIWTLLDGKLHCVTSPLQMQFALGTSSADCDACPVALKHIEFRFCCVVESSYPLTKTALPHCLEKKDSSVASHTS